DGSTFSRFGASGKAGAVHRAFFERTMFQPTLTINGLHGGYGGEGSKAVIPCEAIAKCDIRLVDNMTPQQTLDRVREHVCKHAPDVEFIPRGGMLPSRTSLKSPLGHSIIESIAMARGIKPLIYPSVGGSLPDYVFTKILGIPTFVTPYANADEANHAPNENLKIDLFIDGIKSGAALLSCLGAHGPSQ
ncbi:MAG TPA: peptidase dimerization domain-containing protein, partial [Bellilinea sp.]|nr:peptidase dimerization domain-containing protein [Bellilinea sp.]